MAGYNWRNKRRAMDKLYCLYREDRGTKKQKVFWMLKSLINAKQKGMI